MIKSNPQNLTTKLKRRIDGLSIRLFKEDKTLLSDIARVGVIDTLDASSHYANSNKATSRLEYLVNKGVLSVAQTLHQKHGMVKVYSIANDKIANIWRTTAYEQKRNCSILHDLMVSKAYFAAGRPQSFLLANNLSHQDKDKFTIAKYFNSSGSTPDALYTNSAGEAVCVEADAGQYTSSQISKKIEHWRSMGYTHIHWSKPNFQTTVPKGNNIQISSF